MSAASSAAPGTTPTGTTTTGTGSIPREPDPARHEFDFDGSGAVGGGQLGFNYQTGAWVFGVEGSAIGA